MPANEVPNSVPNAATSSTDKPVSSVSGFPLTNEGTLAYLAQVKDELHQKIGHLKRFLAKAHIGKSTPNPKPITPNCDPADGQASNGRPAEA
ncbi:MAG TPA: hypothetical protein VGI99_11810 [Gemmataceae bacterium]|jgi:hypothetical protein